MRAWILAAFLLAGCGAMPAKEPPPKPFTGTKWQLVMDIPPPGDVPYVRFGDGIMQGYGGCSRFLARYVQDTVGARSIAIGRMEVDRRLCDSMIRAGEARMLEVLQSVSSYTIIADAMTMTGSGGSLRFVAVSDAPTAGAPAPAAAPTAAPAPSGQSLSGTRWRGVVEGVDEASMPWLEFVDGRVAGYTGCNMLSGTWRMDGSVVHMGPLATTKRACAGAGNDVERRVLSTLNEQARILREGSRLIATAPGGERFEFAEVR